MSEDNLSAVQDAPDNIDNDVRAAIDELKLGRTEPQIDVVIDKAETGRTRDEGGKFAKEDKRETLTLPEKKLEGVQSDPGAILGQPKPVAVEAPAPTEIEPPKPVVEPPKGWNADAKAKWNDLPEWAQKEATRREDALTKQLFAHDEARDFGRKLQEVANPYLPTIRQEGATVEKAFENYLQTAHTLRSGTPYQKAQALHAIAQTFSVDLTLPHQQGAINPELADLRQQVQEMRQAQQGQAQERQQAADAELSNHIEAFKSQPGHEHFEEVRHVMGTLMDTNKATDLETAYKMAVRTLDGVHQSQIAAELKATEEKRAAEAKAKADAAKSAAVSVKGSPGGSRPLNGATSHGSIADDLRAAVAEVRGRV